MGTVQLIMHSNMWVPYALHDLRTLGNPWCKRSLMCVREFRMKRRLPSACLWASLSIQGVVHYHYSLVMDLVFRVVTRKQLGLFTGDN
jgi:hypothetical protein